MVSATEQGRERQARQAQQQQLANIEAWDRYVDSRIQRFFDSHRADDSTLPDALRIAELERVAKSTSIITWQLNRSPRR
jgi:hypothetical protein